MDETRKTRMVGGFVSIENEIVVYDYEYGNKVVSFELEKAANRVMITEENQRLFRVWVTKKELAQLIDALQAMHDKMEG